MSRNMMFFCMVLLVMSSEVYSYEWDTFSECQKSLHVKTWRDRDAIVHYGTDWDHVKWCQMEQLIEYLKIIAQNQHGINYRLEAIKSSTDSCT